MTAFERAKALLEQGAALAVVSNECERTFFERGVKSLTSLGEDDRRILRGAAVADKIVGKAAAYLMIAGGGRQA